MKQYLSKKQRVGLAVVGLTLLGVFCWVTNEAMVVRTYILETDKIQVPLRLALVTDLHSCYYGENQEELLDTLFVQNPDVVLLGGDIIDDEMDRLDPQQGYYVVEALAERYPTYYVSGNHEYWSGQVEAIKENLSNLGAVVLEGECHTLEVAGQVLAVAGVDDPDGGERAWQSQLAQVTAQVESEMYTILLTHRPERVSAYEQGNWDLVVAGHAHGGQWRIPGLLNGLIAPDQGLFPKYAGGHYQLENIDLIVSRGLARESTRIPRVWNPPELVVIDVMPFSENDDFS